MRYILRTSLGMALFAFCWVLIAYGIYQLLQVGTCASGGPYVSAGECPAGIERLIFSLIGGIFGLFVALAIYVGRGKPPGSPSATANAGVIVWLWTGLFWSLAVGSFLAVWGPQANPDPGAKLGGLIVGFMGLVMGAGGLLAVNLPGRRRREPTKLGPAVTRVAQAASSFSGQANPIDRIDTLERLRRQGTLTDAEFETLKSRIIKGGS